jgi:hypothetical protein
MDRFVSHAPIWGQVMIKTPSILNLNLIPLGNLSSPPKGVFSQEEINLEIYFI